MVILNISSKKKKLFFNEIINYLGFIQFFL
jgi:hypothetical protein